jgi:hypothetical protein
MDANNPIAIDDLNDDAPCPSESAVVVQWPLSYRLTLPPVPEAPAGSPYQSDGGIITGTATPRIKSQ